MGRITTGWSLARQSWSVIARDRSLFAFPVLSLVTCAVAAVCIVAPTLPFALAELDEPVRPAASAPMTEPGAFAPGTHIDPQSGLLVWDESGAVVDASALAAAGPRPAVPGSELPTSDDSGFPVLFLVVGALVAFVCTTITIFFNVALVSCVRRSLAGHDTTVGEGIRAAWERKVAILTWATFTWTVGMLLRAVSENLPFGGRLLAGVAGVAWAAATLLVVPVIAFEEGVGPLDATRRSTKLLVDRFGEVAIGRTAIGGIILLVTIVLAAPLLVAAFWSFSMWSDVTLGLGLLGVVAVLVVTAGIVGSTLAQVFNTALYCYAVDGGVTNGFSTIDLRDGIEK